MAGANGSGKSTSYQRTSIEEPSGSVWIINPDLLAATIAEVESLDLPAANLEAVQRIERWLNASIDTYQTIGVETVLSTDKYRALVLRAKTRGFIVRFHYVYLSSADLNVERVRIRVRTGGHNVPEGKIRTRRDKSLQQFHWFFQQSDFAEVFDNSGAAPILKLSKKRKAVQKHGELIPEIEAAIENNQ